MTLSYVTNLPRTLTTGGFSGMNVSMLAALESFADVHVVGPVAPPVMPAETRAYRARRALGALHVPGVRPPFVAYSQARLGRIARTVEAGLSEAPGRPAVFHGFTPWVATCPPAPYVAWSDCTFRDYVTIYHRRARFAAADLDRIERAEADWLCRASGVLFTSEWAAARAVADYRLDLARVSVVGFHGAVEPPEADVYGGSLEFAFVSTDFAAKGGPVVAEAFRRVRESWPEARLAVVGAAPPPRVAAQPGIRYAGFLHKEVAAEAAQFRHILATARAVVLPTQADISPLLLAEAALFGCPAIASRRFAIPEIVADGETGILLDCPGDAADVASAMDAVLRAGYSYRAMRTAARARAMESFSVERFRDRVRCALVRAFATSQEMPVRLASAPR